MGRICVIQHRQAAVHVADVHNILMKADITRIRTLHKVDQGHVEEIPIANLHTHPIHAHVKPIVANDNVLNGLIRKFGKTSRAQISGVDGIGTVVGEKETFFSDVQTIFGDGQTGHGALMAERV